MISWCCVAGTRPIPRRWYMHSTFSRRRGSTTWRWWSRAMNFEPPPRPPQAESVVPMINVVFLLLIFFLMSAQLTPPDPFGVEPPVSAEGEPSAPPLILPVSAAGVVAFGEAEGEAALVARGAGAEGVRAAVPAPS